MFMLNNKKSCIYCIILYLEALNIPTKALTIKYFTGLFRPFLKQKRRELFLVWVLFSAYFLIHVALDLEMLVLFAKESRVCTSVESSQSRNAANEEMCTVSVQSMAQVGENRKLVTSVIC